MSVDGSSWWHGRAGDRAGGRAHAVVLPQRERSVLHRWFPTLSGWIRLGAPISLLAPTSLARLLALATWLTVPTMHLIGGLSWPAAVALGVTATGIVALTFRSPALSHRGATAVLAGSFAVIVDALALADGDLRAELALPALIAAALFVGLFMRGRPLLLTLSIGSAMVLAADHLTSESPGISGAVTAVVACWVVGVMSASIAYGARQAGAMDADTGIPNARGVQRQLDKTTEPTLVATVRLVGVGAAREALGHDAGSELVRYMVAQLVRVGSPSMRMGRSADDELVLLVPITGTRDAAERQAMRIVDDAMGEGRVLIDSVEIILEAHVGMAAWSRRDTPSAPSGEPDRSENEDDASDRARDVLRRSSLAARLAANDGVPVRTWDGASTTLTADDLVLLHELRSAADRGQLWIAYQPQVRALDGAVAGVEALIRWRHPDLGDVSPERFIGLAERTGYIDRLTDWVLAEALDAQLRWRAAGIALAVSINVSPLSLRRTDFAGRISEAIVTRGLPASILTVEVTESSAFDVPQAVRRLAPLRGLGVRISIDDFGTGYTSLAILRELAIDEIKIDRCFVQGSVASPANDAIVRSMCELAHQLGLSAVAEGASDHELVHRLQVAGYDLIQGYALSAPRPEDDLLEWLSSRRVDGHDGGRAGIGSVAFVGALGGMGGMGTPIRVPARAAAVLPPPPVGQTPRVSPVSPIAPIETIVPITPMTPTAPITPVTPIAPIAPVTPFAPVTPIAPIADVPASAQNESTSCSRT